MSARLPGSGEGARVEPEKEALPPTLFAVSASKIPKRVGASGESKKNPLTGVPVAKTLVFSRKSTSPRPAS